MNAVITGASKGMGKAIAEKFASNGYDLFLCSRKEEELLECKRELESKYNVEIYYYPADLSIKSQAIGFGNWILSKERSIDILINNAGQFIPGSIYNEEDGTLEKMIGVNLYAAYHLTRTLLPSLMERKQGHIFNISSIAALKAYANGGAYSISKFAIAGLSKNLREEMKPYSIKVTTVYPGAVYTASWFGSGIESDRIMEVNDIADMIYSCSQLSPQACVEEIIIRPQKGDI
jgi:short-subunit dehydrogenase